MDRVNPFRQAAGGEYCIQMAEGTGIIHVFVFYHRLVEAEVKYHGAAGQARSATVLLWLHICQRSQQQSEDEGDEFYIYSRYVIHVLVDYGIYQSAILISARNVRATWLKMPILLAIWLW